MPDSTADDALVVGGGLAGAATAIELARLGRPVSLVERSDRARHKVCGEFFSAEACGALRDFGVDLEKLGGASIARLRLACGGDVVETALPFAAWSASRLRVDEALLERAGACGVAIARGSAARAIEDGAVRIASAAGERVVRPSALVLASGKVDVRGAGRVTHGASDAIGFKMHYRLAPRSLRALAGCVELSLFDAGYAGLQEIENGTVAFALVVRRAHVGRLGAWSDALAAIRDAVPSLDARLAGADALWERPRAISPLPYGYAYRPVPTDRIYRVGDQFAVIASFTGDGMAIALHSGIRAARAIAGGASPHRYHAALRAELGRPLGLARALSTVVATPLGRRGLVAACGAVPELLAGMARFTRIPQIAPSRPSDRRA